MKLNEFMAMEKSGGLFKLIDATKQGYMNDMCWKVITFADRNVCEEYGDCDVVGFRPNGKNSIVVYIK